MHGAQIHHKEISSCLVGDHCHGGVEDDAVSHSQLLDLALLLPLRELVERVHALLVDAGVPTLQIDVLPILLAPLLLRIPLPLLLPSHVLRIPAFASAGAVEHWAVRDAHSFGGSEGRSAGGGAVALQVAHLAVQSEVVDLQAGLGGLRGFQLQLNALQGGLRPGKFFFILVPLRLQDVDHLHVDLVALGCLRRLLHPQQLGQVQVSLPRPLRHTRSCHASL
mmetsp:Transcript_19293/g.43008  ORF Transcript_19293/g.43008 Transcript_19293/m.43008 type:complete len:222 (+) Transcript_19293:182-847(+)